MLDSSKLDHDEKLAYDAICKLFDILPEKYEHYNLAYLCLFKAAFYNGGILNIYRRNLKIFKKVSPLIRNKWLASKITYNVQKYIDRNYNNELDRNDKFEFESIFKKRSLPVDDITNQKVNLFIASMSSYLQTIVQYIRFDKNYHNKIIIPRYLEGHKALDSISKEDIYIFEDFIDSKMKSEIKKIEHELKSTFDKNENYFFDIFSIDSNSLYPFFSNGIRNIFYYLIPNAILYSMVAESIFDKFKVNSVVCVRQKRTYENAFIRTSRAHGIKRFMMIHGNIYRENGWRLTFGHFSNLDGLFVWGEEQKNVLEKYYDVSNSIIYKFGSPLFIHPKRTPKLKSNKIKILFAVDEIKDCDNEINALIDSLNSLDTNHELILKPHPGVDAKSYSRFNNNNILIKNENEVIENLFDEVDIFVTKPSTTLLQSMICDLPSIITSMRPKDPIIINRNFNFNNIQKEYFVVNNKKEFSEKIKNLISSSKYNKIHKSLQKEFISKNVCNYKELLVAVRDIRKVINK